MLKEVYVNVTLTHVVGLSNARVWSVQCVTFRSLVYILTWVSMFYTMSLITWSVSEPRGTPRLG